jgi:hypothetical protein
VSRVIDASTTVRLVVVALSIYAALVSTVLAGIALRQAARDRPRLIIEWNWNAGSRGVWLGVNVSSRPGGQGTTLTQVGLAIEGVADLSHVPGTEYPPGEPRSSRGSITFPLSEATTPIAPGERESFIRPAGALPPLVDADTPLVPYAIDIEGRRHVGTPMPIFQRLFDEGWIPPERPTFPHLFVTYTEPPELAGQNARFDTGPS